jgi:hypothetical protein
MRFTKTEISNLDFDADLMGYRLVFIEKPLDENHFVLYYKKPELTYIGHYRRVRDLQEAMQKHYRQA